MKSQNGTAGLRHEVLDAIRHALALAKLEKPLTDRSIHEIRKQVKRARAGLRLLRDAVTGAEYHRENALLRNAARALGPARDAAVLLAVATKLRATPAGKRERDAIGRVASAVREHRSALISAAPKAAHDKVAPLLADAEARFSRWRFPFDLRPIVSHGLKRSYRKARDAAQSARSQRSDAALHEARKQSKYVANALELLRPAERRMLKAGKRADSVAKRLGADHDLAVFAATLARQAKANELPRSIARTRRKLQQDALARSKKLYKLKPKVFAKRATL